MLTDGSLVYYLVEFDCTGRENLLSDCKHSGVGAQCFVRFEEAGAMCSSRFYKYMRYVCNYKECMVMIIGHKTEWKCYMPYVHTFCYATLYHQQSTTHHGL